MTTKVLFSTLYPLDVRARREDLNTLELVQDYLAGFQCDYELRVVVASAHESALLAMKQVLEKVAVAHELLLVPFQPRREHFDLRGHEIAFGKQWLAEKWKQYDFDFLLYLDADIWMPFRDVKRCVSLIRDPLQFVQIPYVLRDRSVCPRHQLGAFVHGKALLERIDYVPAVYCPFWHNRRLFRKGAPDSNIKCHLQKHGAVCVRAEDVRSHHYLSHDRYRLFDRGRIDSECLEDAYVEGQSSRAARTK